VVGLTFRAVTVHANHATGELNEQQYTEKARELLGMIGRLRNALFHKSMA
jgi:hypothetical protein